MTAPIKSRLKAITHAQKLFTEKLEQLYRTKYTHNEIRALKADIEALEYMKTRLEDQKTKTK